MYVLQDIGNEVETAYGKTRFWFVYLFSAVGGALTSIFINPLLVSAGASGAIFGVFGAMLAIVWRRPELFPKGYLLLHGKIVLCLVLYSIVFSFIDKNADNAAHFGGFFTGFIAGLCVLPMKDEAKNWTKKQALSTAVLTIGLAGLCGLSYKLFAEKPDVLAERHYRKAIDLLKDEKFSEAIPLLDQTLALTPQNGDAYCDRARANAELKHFDQALADCGAALKISDSNKTAYTVRASVHQKMGNYKLAIDDLTKVIKLDPNNAMAYNNRAWSKEAAGQYEESLEDCNKSLELKGDNATTYDTRAVAYILMNKFDQALTDLDKAIAIKSGDGAYYYHRAIARSRAHRDSSGVDVDTAKKLGYEPEPWEPRL